MLSRRKLFGGSPDILAKSLANPDKIFNFFLHFCRIGTNKGRKLFAEIQYLRNIYLQMHNDFDAGHVQDDKEKSPLI